MPQLHLLHPTTDMTGLRLVFWAPKPGVREHTELEVSVSVGHKPLMPLTHHKIIGVEADYLDTYATAAVTAWAYEAERRDVARALNSVQRLARAHRRTSEF